MSSKTNSEISTLDIQAREYWDTAAFSYAKAKPSNLGWKYVTLPFLEKLCGNISKSSVLDAGCGVGDLYDLFVHKPATYFGVDWSRNIIDIAKSRYPNNQFMAENIYFLNEERIGRFDYIFATNVLQDCEDLPRAATALFRCLNENGRMFVIIENPYWTAYSLNNITDSPKLPVNATNEVYFSNFISPEMPIMGFHRPLSYYRKVFGEVGFDSVFHGVELPVSDAIHDDQVAKAKFKKIGAFDTDIFSYFELIRKSSN